MKAYSVYKFSHLLNLIFRRFYSFQESLYVSYWNGLAMHKMRIFLKFEFNLKTALKNDFHLKSLSKNTVCIEMFFFNVSWFYKNKDTQQSSITLS